MAEIEMPQLGETVTEGTITQWFKQVGDNVSQDELLFEVSTDKVDTEVPSPVAGTLTEIRVPEGETVDVGTILAVVGDPSAAPQPPPSTMSSATTTVEVPNTESSVLQQPPPVRVEANAAPEPAVAPPVPEPEATQHAKVLSPVVRRLINEYAIDPSNIEGTGLGGRISRDDVQRYIEANQARAGASDANSTAAPGDPVLFPPPKVDPQPQSAETHHTAPPAPASAAPQPPTAPMAQPQAQQTHVVPVPAPAPAAHPAPLVQAGPRDAVVPLSNIRLRTAEHMVMSKSVAPHTLTAIEVDYENVERVRRSAGSEFKAAEGFSLTYLPFISRAAVDALREYPHLNASVGDRELIVHNYVNLAVAVDLDFQGLLAPVVRDADGKRMRSIARDVNDLAARARAKRLAPDELSGGTFTLTNAGSYGTMMQFPIINQPQVAILSTDAVKRKPVVVSDEYDNESITIHSVGVLAMAWDHRAIDGAYAAAFLARMKEILETRDWSAELV